jgi:MFS family permease
VVFGSFCALVGSLGVCNTIGSIHAWISEHHLKGHGDGAVGWIFGVYAFLLFFGGLQIGPVFDAKGPKFLVLAGSIMLVASMILLGFCQQYWHFMLAFSVLGGIGSSLVFTPAVASSGHFFYRLRGRATGMAATGGSIGGVVFPLMLDALFPKVGFAWATRAVALICLVTLSLGCVLIKSRLPKKRATKENILPDFRIFKEVQFTLTTAGIFCIEWGLFIPITYISSYGIYYGMPRRLSYQLLAILNAGSFFGRLIPGYTADYMGRFNTMILTVLLCLLTNTCLWLPANGNLPMMVAYAFIFGFASGSNISLTPVCVGQICKTEHYGRYYATAYTIVSFG